MDELAPVRLNNESICGSFGGLIGPSFWPFLIGPSYWHFVLLALFVFIYCQAMSLHPVLGGLFAPVKDIPKGLQVRSCVTHMHTALARSLRVGGA